MSNAVDAALAARFAGRPREPIKPLDQSPVPAEPDDVAAAADPPASPAEETL